MPRTLKQCVKSRTDPAHPPFARCTCDDKHVAMHHTPTTELLAPAGTLKNMRYAFAYGADAVYAGQPRYSLRVRNNDFQLENLQIGIDEAHTTGVSS